MAGITKIDEIEARKRALVTECELCREALKAEVKNLQAYGDGFFRKVDRVRSLSPWALLAAPALLPLVKMLFGKKTEAPKASYVKGPLAMVLLGFRLYRQYGPLVRSLAARFLGSRRTAAEARDPAANI